MALLYYPVYGNSYQLFVINRGNAPVRPDSDFNGHLYGSPEAHIVKEVLDPAETRTYSSRLYPLPRPYTESQRIA
jgi:hypothetical protein